MIVNEVCWTLSAWIILSVLSAHEASVTDHIAARIESFAYYDHYELLNVKDVNVRRVKRSIDSYSEAINQKEIAFYSFGKYFNLQLQQTREILSDDFKVFKVDKCGNRKPVTVYFGEYYKGYLKNHLNTKVNAHIDSKTGMLTASIYDHDTKQTYFVEPIDLAIPELNDNNDTMIIYRPQDFNIPNDQNRNQSFCAYIKVDDELNLNSSTSNSSTTIVNTLVNDHNLNKRHIFSEEFWDKTQKEEPTKCSLRLVADYTFYEHIGGSDLKKTINFLITLIQRVNEIFESTGWQYTSGDTEIMHGYGFLVGELIVHEQTSETFADDLTHYNSHKSNWSVRDLLEAFARSPGHRSFCLAHLFTHKSFDNGVLGLAYVASPRKHSFGGVCSPWYDRENHRLYLNTGLSTTLNTFGRRVPMRQAVLVTAHELGHNWGAEHDPAAAECSPKQSQGGSFIMNTFAVSSYEPNNVHFSACSRRSVKSVLLSKSSECFSRPKRTFCGNGIREPGEDCDPGLAAGPTGDECCTASCRFKPNAKCSDRNQPCCVSCMYAPALLRLSCRDANELDCQAEAICNGTSASCPSPVALPDETACAEDGKCRYGRCLPFCETHSMISCLCEHPNDACLKCCRQTLNSTCRPWTHPNSLRLRDGTPCVRGLCNAGRCVQMAHDYVERFWRIIDDIQIDSFQKFLKDNLVACIIVASLFIFVPACYFIEKHDQVVKNQYKIWQKQQQQRLARLSSNTTGDLQPNDWQQRWRQQWNSQRMNALSTDRNRREFGQIAPRLARSQASASNLSSSASANTHPHPQSRRASVVRANRISFSNRPAHHARGRILQVNNLSPYTLYAQAPDSTQSRV